VEIGTPPTNDPPAARSWMVWFGNITAVFKRIRTYTPTINPASVTANSESLQTFTVEGLTVSDVVTVNKPTDTAGISISQAYVSATDTLAIKFRNHTGSNIDPPSETYRVMTIRHV
jgi:hypothetical protein